ncbi:MAG: hypothetical protein KDE23_13480 [Caldilinea sp.]|nr:hypothetical protein [Caldilinea sp.]
MNIINGKDAVLEIAGQNGEWHGLGDIDYSSPLFIDLTDMAKAMADMGQALAKVAMQLNEIDWDAIRRILNIRWLHAHGGQKLRRRKHGGRWAKIDRRRRKPPLWLAEYKTRKRHV